MTEPDRSAVGPPSDDCMNTRCCRCWGDQPCRYCECTPLRHRAEPDQPDTPAIRARIGSDDFDFNGGETINALCDALDAARAQVAALKADRGWTINDHFKGEALREMRPAEHLYRDLAGDGGDCIHIEDKELCGRPRAEHSGQPDQCAELAPSSQLQSSDQPDTAALRRAYAPADGTRVSAEIGWILRLCDALDAARAAQQKWIAEYNRHFIRANGAENALRNAEAQVAALTAERDEPTLPWRAGYIVWKNRALQAEAERDAVREVLGSLSEARRELGAARWYLGLLEKPNVLVQRDALRAKLREIEDFLDDPDAVGHGLFCASHYEQRPCDCWAAKLAAILDGETS